MSSQKLDLARVCGVFVSTTDLAMVFIGQEQERKCPMEPCANLVNESGPFPATIDFEGTNQTSAQSRWRLDNLALMMYSKLV